MQAHLVQLEADLPELATAAGLQAKAPDDTTEQAAPALQGLASLFSEQPEVSAALATVAKYIPTANDASAQADIKDAQGDTGMGGVSQVAAEPHQPGSAVQAGQTHSELESARAAASLAADRATDAQKQLAAHQKVKKEREAERAALREQLRQAPATKQTQQTAPSGTPVSENQ